MWIKSLTPQKQMMILMVFSSVLIGIAGAYALTGNAALTVIGLLYLIVFFGFALFNLWWLFGLIMYVFIAGALILSFASGRFDPTQEMLTFREQSLVAVTIVITLFMVGFTWFTNWINEKFLAWKPRLKASEQ